MNISIDNLFEEHLVASHSPANILEILAVYGLQSLQYDDDIGRNPGFIFRGEADWKVPLQPKIERLVRPNPDEALDVAALKQMEKKVITQFIEGEGGACSGNLLPRTDAADFRCARRRLLVVVSHAALWRRDTPDRLYT